MLTNRRRRLWTLLVTMMILTATAGAWAQDAAAPGGKKLAEQWEDLLHYIKVARPDLAKSFGDAVLNSGKPREVYLLSVQSKSAQSVLARGTRLAGMEETIQRLQKMIDNGYQAMRTDPAEIERSINMLPISVKSYARARERLMNSGEFALPQMVQKLMDPRTDNLLRERIVQVIPSLGKEIVRPLSVALQTRDEKLREIFASALAEVEYPHSAARLKELHGTEGLLKRTEVMVESALITCAGKSALSKSVSQMYYDLSLKYYYQDESVRPDERNDKANVWYWNNDSGLSFVPVPRQIFCDIYAMRMARLALDHDDEFYPAVSLWLAANLKREADLPAGGADPTLPDGAATAKYYIRAAGATFAQEVLGRALNDYNSTVAIGAIEALRLTAGAKSLVEPIESGDQPLVQAMTYPDRRVRFLAAVSLATARPVKRFTGYDLVLMTLNEAMRQTGKQAALIIAADEKQGNLLKDAVRAAGYTVLVRADTKEGMKAARAIGGVDLVAIAAVPTAAEVVPMLRQEGIFAAVPVLVAASETLPLRNLAKEDKRMILAGGELTPGNLAQALSQVTGLAAGKAMGEGEVTQWAVRSAKAIRLLGQTKNPVFDVSVTRTTLMAALAAPQDSVRIAAAEALAVMREADSQRAICTLAVDTEASEPVRVAAMGALAESVRAFGNQLTEAQAQAILDIVMDEKADPLRNGAAQDLGALNLRSDQIRDLITTTEQ
jgi:hypothetical protein